MSLFIRILLSVLTLITFVALVVFTVIGFKIGQPVLVVACAALAVVFGIFLYADVKYWLGQLNAQKQTQAPPPPPPPAPGPTPPSA